MKLLFRAVGGQTPKITKPVQVALIEMSRQIQKIEAARVFKNRSERSKRAPESQLIHDAKDKVSFCCYRLSDEEALYVYNDLERCFNGTY